MIVVTWMLALAASNGNKMLVNRTKTSKISAQSREYPRGNIYHIKVCRQWIIHNNICYYIGICKFLHIFIKNWAVKMGGPLELVWKQWLHTFCESRSNWAPWSLCGFFIPSQKHAILIWRLCKVCSTSNLISYPEPEDSEESCFHLRET